MLKAGIIGNLKSFESVVKHIRSKNEVQITGKSTIGVVEKDNALRFSIPEFSRSELIDRSDVLLVNNFSLLPFATLSSMVKMSKHIFAAEYPVLSREELSSLSKLIAEAKTVFYIINPFYNLPGIEWIKENLKHPFHLDINYFNEDFGKEKNILKLLLMLKAIGSGEPKRISALHFESNSGNGIFYNVRLEYGNASVVNLNFGKHFTDTEFDIRGHAGDLFFRYNALNAELICNMAQVATEKYERPHEFDSFIETIISHHKIPTDISDYISVLQLIEIINKKLDQFSSN